MAVLDRQRERLAREEYDSVDGFDEILKLVSS